MEQKQIDEIRAKAERIAQMSMGQLGRLTMIEIAQMNLDSEQLLAHIDEQQREIEQVRAQRDAMSEIIRIKMLYTVRADTICGIFPPSKPGTILREGVTYIAQSNIHGAISGLCANGEWLGVKPGEFEFVTAPMWVQEIHGVRLGPEGGGEGE